MPTYPLESPAAFGLASVQWERATNSARALAPWTFQRIVQIYDGRMWRGTLEVAPLDRADGRRLAGWITALDGVAGSFLFGDPESAAPLGLAGAMPGAPVVDGAAQTGRTLAIRGAPPDLTGYLLRGDCLQLGSGAGAQLYRIADDADTDGAGETVLDIWPQLRSSPGDGDPVVLLNPEGVFALAGPVDGWQVRPPAIYSGVALQIEEVVP